MANIMSEVRVKNTPTRSGFDLSERDLFSSKVGVLYPVMSRELLPGDHVEYTPEWFTRTRPVNTAAFTRFREYYDFFFVPTRLLWHLFPQYVMQLPNDTQSNDDGVMPTSSNMDPTNIVSECPGINISDIETILGSLHYFEKTVPSNESTKDIMGFSRYENSKRLLNMLGFGRFDYIDNWAARTPGDGDPTRTDRPVNLWRLAAYHKIYTDYYRYSQWERPNPYLFNFDCFSRSGAKSVASYYTDWYNDIYSHEHVIDMPFDFHYCNWNKDLFTGLLPRAQYGDVATVNIDPTSNPISLDSSGRLTFGTSNGSITTGFGVATGGTAGSNTLHGLNEDGQRSYFTSIENVRFSAETIGTLNILALRQAEMRQKWSEIQQSNRLDYRSQVNAHFGVTPPAGLDMLAQYVGGCAGNLSINEVVNQNLSGDNSADIAGKGIGSGRGQVQFTAKEHGVFMCIYHILPLLDWGAYGLDKENTHVLPTDYAIPEFDRVGMESVPGYILTDPAFNSSSAGVNTKDGFLGYAPRYIEYKTALDKVYGAFLDNDTDRTWVTMMDLPLIQLLLLTSDGYTPIIDYRFFKVNPSYVNSIFPFDAGDKSDTDHFLNVVSFKAHAARNLDYDGLPY